MALPNIFTKNVADQLIQRIDKLKPTSQAKWGKMNVAQMLAHCNVTYEMAFESKRPQPIFFMGLILKVFVKKNGGKRYALQKEYSNCPGVYYCG